MQSGMRKKIGVAVAAVVTIAAVVAAVSLGVPGIVWAQTATPPASSTPNAAPPSGNNQAGRVNNPASYLAQALGISVSDLQAAVTKARSAEIDAAVKAGTITQAQADALKNGTSRQPVNLGISAADRQKYLADALGKSVSDLQTAEMSAYKAALAAAVAAGRITQAQADNALARQALAKYIADQGLFAQALKGAVAAGVITQAQADMFLNQYNQAGGGFGGFGPGLGGFGGFGGFGPGAGPRGFFGMPGGRVAPGFGPGFRGGRGNLPGRNVPMPRTAPNATPTPNA
jgi:hypothetical protein